MLRIFACCLGCSLFAGVVAVPAAAQQDGDPEGARNRAAEARLPEGEGLAARYPADRGIATDRRVRFAADFETGELGAGWDEVRNKDDRVLELVDRSADHGFLGQRSLAVKADLEHNTGGGATKWFPSADALFVRFYVRFDEDADYIHHFVTLRANKSLQGGGRWSGFGGAGDRPAGDTRFSTALEPWGDWGRNTPPGKWNFYSYWHQMKASPDGRYWGNGFRPAEQPAIEKGRWICCEFMLKHNTPGEADGEQAYWIDGQLRGHWTGINWRTAESLQANALTLESYVTDRWTKQRFNTVLFDNLVIASEYIGPATE